MLPIVQGTARQFPKPYLSPRIRSGPVGSLGPLVEAVSGAGGSAAGSVGAGVIDVLTDPPYARNAVMA